MVQATTIAPRTERRLAPQETDEGLFRGPDAAAWGWQDTAIKVATALISLALVGVGVGYYGVGQPLWLAQASSGTWLAWFVWPGLVLTGLVLISFIYRTVLWARYRPLDGSCIAEADLPTITVVIPAYNEGPMVKKSILSAVECDYPRDKLEIICINDGSKDDTIEHMEDARSCAPELVTVIDCKVNRGKRHALYEGIVRASGEVIVTVDSDSVLNRQSLRNIVAPFVGQPKIGAVAGCVKVFNRYQNVLTRMLGVRFLLGFEFTRAYQSVLRTVYCCPGAFAAYRKVAIMPQLETWLRQTFMGLPCNNGDDHALTSVVLRERFDTVYQGNADAETVVPHTYKKFSKMLLRWARSSIRESFIYLGFGWHRAREEGGWLAYFDGVIQAIQIPARYYSFVGMFVLLAVQPDLMIRLLAWGTIMALVYTFFFLKSERTSECLYGVVYSWFAIFALQWIYPWAGLTIRNNGWLTRDLTIRTRVP